jgi:spore coat polysaccharide biosynthesis protein SpsF
MKNQEFPKIAAVIACRVNSTRLFGKPLQLVGNYTILHLLINQLKKSKRIDEIVLAISDKPGNEIFVDFAKKNRIKFIIGKEDHVLERLVQGTKHVKARILFRKTSEDPFICWEIIDKVLERHVNDKCDITFLDDVPVGSCYEVINLKVLENEYMRGSKKQENKTWVFKIRKDKSLKKLRYLPEKYLQRKDLRLTVDTPQDLLLARIIHNKLGNKDKPIHLKRIIEFLDNNSKIKKINSDVGIGKSKIT